MCIEVAHCRHTNPRTQPSTSKTDQINENAAITNISYGYYNGYNGLHGHSLKGEKKISFASLFVLFIEFINEI